MGNESARKGQVASSSGVMGDGSRKIRNRDDGVSGGSKPLAVDIHNATVFRKDILALTDISLRIREGENVAILGPNGSGKSSLIKLITRELYAVERLGSHVKLFGQARVQLEQLRQRLGLISHDLQADYTPYTCGFDVVLSGFFGSIGSHERLQATDDQCRRAGRVIEEVGLAALQQRMFQHLSTGQQRRFLVARAVVNRPQLLVLDEPTTGLDIGSSFKLLRMIRQMNDDQTGILLATHHLEEIVPEIDRVVLLENGRIVVDGPKVEVLSKDNLSRLYGTELDVVEKNGWYQVFSAH